MAAAWHAKVEQWLFGDGHVAPAPLRRLVQFVWATIRDLFEGHLTLRATGLVYVTILSIVPVIAISFSVLKAFGFHRQLEPLISNVFAPLGAQGAEITASVIGFVDNVQGNVLAGIGLALLFVTTVSMAERVEDSFNYVWRVDRPRNLARRFSDYLTVILVGPVVMVTAMGLIASLESNTLLQRLAVFRPVGVSLELLGNVAPYLLVCGAFTFIYWFIPNTRVTFRAAAVGGLVGGGLWAGTGMLFARVVALSSATLTIYATFAIVIVALLWVYLCWLTLLLGAQVAFYQQNPSYLRVGYRPLLIGSRQREQMALALMLAVATAFRQGAARPTVDSVARGLGMPHVAVTPVLARLEAAGLVTRSERDELLPNRDPTQVALRDILAAVREPLMRDALPEGRWPAVVDELTGRIRTSVDAALGGETLAELAERASRT